MNDVRRYAGEARRHAWGNHETLGAATIAPGTERARAAAQDD